ncbi:Coiled stalk of trimeric autotransporter adhesin [Megasphaera elsdenii]|nr:Coiled stalk of trimeric autotransporter adhesin [Megasphaera elsdenii]
MVRTITNVAAGRVTPTSTDAVNGSELYAVAIEAAKHATVKAAANSRITVDNTGVNKGKGIEYTIGLNTDGLAKSTDGLTFAGDDGKSDNSKVISRKLNEQLNIVGGATETVDAANIGVVRKDDDTLNIRLAKDITGLNSLQATTVTSGNVTVDGQHNVITGLSNTTWDKTKDYSQSTKAATEAQLHEAMTQATADANDTHITAGDYAVGTITDKDGQSVQGVSIDVVDKTGKVGTVRITDVAKASDVGNVTDLNADIKNAEGKTTVVDAVNHVDNKVGNLDYSSTKYVKKGEDVTTSIGKLDEAIKYASEAAGKHTIVSTEDANLSVENIAKEGEAANYQISLNKDLNVDSVTAANKITTKDLEVTGSAAIGKVTINKDDKGTIGGLTNKTWDAKNITSGQAATEDQLQAATKNAVNYDGDDSKTVTLREDTTIQNVANTTIEEGSKNAVNAGTVYKETRVEKDGIFIRQANTAGQNITALDHQVAANTESIYHINNRVSDLDNRVNKVGAGAAALAALHPLDFDPNDKWDFAVGYGNYRNANSVALGAFYRPNEDTMFSLGTNFGNGENMFNAGLSFKIGQGGSGITTSKTAMAKKIESLENTVDQQDKKIAELEALVKEQGEMIRQYVGKK